MLKLIKYLKEQGRRQAYLEIVVKLERLADALPKTRDGRITRQPIDETVSDLLKQLDEGGK